MAGSAEVICKCDDPVPYVCIHMAQGHHMREKLEHAMRRGRRILH